MAAALFFLRVFLYFYYSRNPYLSKNVMLCKILFMSFHVKTTLFHRFNKFPLCEERKTSSEYMPRYSMRVCMCLCVPVCLRIIYGMPLHIASSEPVKKRGEIESKKNKYSNSTRFCNFGFLKN